ncbi:MAG: LytTR family DNA-binding domain-containing protein [Pelobium sp.]
MKAIAIDDEPLALEVIRSHASKVPFLNLQADFTNAFTALEYLQKEQVDLLFLDIKMPDISGIDFFSTLAKKPLVIFTTAYTEHAVTSFELDAVDYLLKPFSLARFLKACNKAFEMYNYRQLGPTVDHVFIKSGNEQYKVLFQDILYLEAAGNYVSFVLKEKSILSRLTFNEAMNLIPYQDFLRVHRSYIIAINKIDKIERHQVTIGALKIPVSEIYLPDLMKLGKK